MSDKVNISAPAKPPTDSDPLVGPLFLANFVHQVVNPLNGVIGTLDNIYDGTYAGDVVRQKINSSRAQLEQCVTLIRNLAYLSDFFFEVSGKDALRQPRESATSILPQVVIEAAQFFQIPGEKKNIHIELVDARSQYKLQVRPELLKQVFINMFDNWIKYGSQNQTVRILSHVNKRKDLVIETVGLSDGFDNAKADRLFELGYRSPEAMNRVAQGSGIGLYICRQIVEHAIFGTITAEHNKKTSESTFRILVPRGRWLL